jgi:hypothetical protein
MSFETEKFIFGHIPKCGGTFIKSVSAQIGIIKKYYIGEFGYHAPIHMFNEELPILISVRHPYDWYISQYNFLTSVNWIYDTYYEDFDKWFDATIQFKTMSFYYYDIMGCCRSEDYFIKLENLRSDYIKFLYDIGYDLSVNDIQIIQKYKKENISNNDSNIVLSSSQKEKIRKADAEIFKRYNFIS